MLIAFAVFCAVFGSVSAEFLFSVEKTSPDTITCADTKSQLDSKKIAKISGTNGVSFYLSYRNLGINEDPVLIRFDGAVQTFCKTDIVTSADDERGIALAWDSSKSFLYGFFTTKGNSPPTFFQSTYYQGFVWVCV